MFYAYGTIMGFFVALSVSLLSASAVFAQASQNYGQTSYGGHTQGQAVADGVAGLAGVRGVPQNYFDPSTSKGTVSGGSVLTHVDPSLTCPPPTPPKKKCICTTDSSGHMSYSYVMQGAGGLWVYASQGQPTSSLIPPNSKIVDCQ